VVPFLGVLIYLISQGQGMVEREALKVQGRQAHWDATHSEPAHSDHNPVAQIAQAKELLDSGVISQKEYETIKQKALVA
jgi:hypothetical protein